MMKWVLLAVIRLYRALKAPARKPKCIFRQSCSHYVYAVTEREGLHRGVLALRFRLRNCRHGFHLFDDPADGTRRMILPGGLLIGEEEIAERFLVGLRVDLIKPGQCLKG